MDDEDDLPCACGPLQWSCCQRFRSIKLMLFILCIAGAIQVNKYMSFQIFPGIKSFSTPLYKPKGTSLFLSQGMVVNGFVSVVISTIEKRFELASTQSGLIASSYDIASVLCLIPVSYIGGAGHKPRWLGAGVMLMGLGSFVFALPHFITGVYEYNLTPAFALCDVNRTDSCTSSTDTEQTTSLSSYRYMLMLGQLLHGAGATPLYTLGITYLDGNVKAKWSSVYVGKWPYN